MDEILERARHKLREVFGFSDFRAGQSTAMRDVLERQDVVVVMPTGSGKSLLYQLPAVLFEGTVLVVSPLISLMKDQVDGLCRRSIRAAFINSALSAGEKRMATARMENGEYQLVYVAPERFQVRDFQEALKRTEISMLAVDEAHCVSLWGQDFRPDYLKIKDIREMLHFPQTIALTATATGEVRREIAERLGLTSWRDHVAGFDRDNLYFSVRPVSGQKEKIDHLVEIYRTWGASGIVYASTRKNVEKVALDLRAFGIRTASYHGGMADVDRQAVQNAFMDGSIPVIVATNAFGMGVDKANIRFVAHFDIPANIEAYYQEVGRAGRDGQKSCCCLLFNYADTRVPRFFIDQSHPQKSLIEKVLHRISGSQLVLPEDLHSLFGGEMSARYALGILERAGLLMPIPGGYAYTPDAGGEEKLAAILENDRQRKANDEAKLEQMIRYAYHTGCRRLWILDYFGDRSPYDHCDACDNCRQGDFRQEITGERLIEILKALSAVARLEGKAGKSRFAQVLVGSKCEAILRMGWDRIPTYGALSYMSKGDACRLIEDLIAAGYLTVRLKDGNYPLLYLTPSGREVMMQRQPCYLPKDLIPEVAGSCRAAPEDPVAPTAAPRKESRSASKNRKSPTGEAKRSAPDADPELYEKLVKLRLEIAHRIHKPAFIVFSNSTLVEMAAKKPGTIEEMGKITGVGPYKLASYAREFLEIIRAREAK